MILVEHTELENDELMVNLNQSLHVLLGIMIDEKFLSRRKT